MLRAWTPLVVALLAAPGLAGCLSGTVDESLVEEALARPWLDNWSIRSFDLAVEYDPESRHVTAEGRYVLQNDLGVARDHANLWMPIYEITRLEDGEGRPLEYTRVRFMSPAPVPEDVRRMLPGQAMVVNVTLGGDVGPGATSVIVIAYEGWAQSELTVPASLPNEFGAYFGAVSPITTFQRTLVDARFTLAHPDSWVVLAAAEPVETATEGGRTTTSYVSKEPRVLVFAANGLEWLEDDVEGVAVRTYFYPDMRVQGRAAHDVTLRVLRVMPEYTGPYPFGHLWTVPHQVVANAFSTPGLTFMGLNFYRFTVPYAPYQFGRLTPYVGGQDGFEMVVVHEHVHNWWGHNVRGNNTDPDLGPRDTWISEGLTTYLSEMVWFDTQYGAKDAKASSDGKVVDQLVRKRVVGEERAITEAGGDHYEKTALAMRALEAYAIQSGRPHVVFDALNLAQERFGRLQGGEGLADTEQMIAVFEEAFGEDLRWHFDPWFLGRDLADLSVASVQRDGDAVVVGVANGPVPAAVLVRATTATGRELVAWGFAEADATSEVRVPVPAAAGAEPVVRIDLDALQHVYESDEANNVWIGRA